MATVAKNILLEEAVRQSQSMGDISCLWIIEENILNLEVPQDHTFSSIGVVWHSFTNTCTAAVDFTRINCKEGHMRGLKKGNKPFINLEELRTAHPTLFKVKGEFRILQRY